MKEPNVSAFSYRVQLRPDLSVGTDQGEVGVINARGDGNCGPRAVIQSLLLRGVLTAQQHFVADFLSGLFQRQSHVKDLVGRSLYSADIRKMRVLPDDLTPYRKSLIQVGDFRDCELHYIDEEGHANLVNIKDRAKYRRMILAAGKYSDLNLDAEFNDRKTRVNIENLNECVAKPLDITSKIQVTIADFLKRYRAGELNDLATLREGYFGNDEDVVARHDEVIYVFAGCLRFDMLQKDICIDHHEKRSIQTLETEMGLDDMFGYLNHHGITLTWIDRTLHEEHSAQAYLALYGVELLPSKISVDVYRSPNHFGTLVYRTVDAAPHPVHAPANPGFLMKFWSSLMKGDLEAIGAAALVATLLVATTVACLGAAIPALLIASGGLLTYGLFRLGEKMMKDVPLSQSSAATPF